MKIKVNLNGLNKIFEIEPGDYIVDTLRSNGILSVKRGCETSSCGACTILLEGKPVPSCATLAVKTDGLKLTTVEGIREDIDLMAEYFGEEGADQCGFCNPSLALTAYSLKKLYKDPSDDTIKDYLVGNLCRCTGYEAQLKAIKKYLGAK